MLIISRDIFQHQAIGEQECLPLFQRKIMMVVNTKKFCIMNIQMADLNLFKIVYSLFLCAHKTRCKTHKGKRKILFLLTTCRFLCWEVELSLKNLLVSINGKSRGYCNRELITKQCCLAIIRNQSYHVPITTI